jgi:hypothetical protein
LKFFGAEFMKDSPVCHKQVNDTASFCHKCGYDFDIGETSQNPEDVNSPSLQDNQQEKQDSEFPVRELSMGGPSPKTQQPPQDTSQEFPPNAADREADPTPGLTDAEKEKLQQKFGDGGDSQSQPKQTRQPTPSRSQKQTDSQPQQSKPRQMPPQQVQQRTEPSSGQSQPSGATTQATQPVPVADYIGRFEMLLGRSVGVAFTIGGVFRILNLPGPNEMVAYGTIGIILALAVIAISLPMADLPRSITSGIYGAVGLVGTFVFALSGLLLPGVVGHWLLAVELSASFLALSTAVFPYISQYIES